MSKGRHRKGGAEKEKPVELGFIEEVDDTWKLASAFFASKFGGIPSWLDLKNLPKPRDIQCPSCSGPPKFLMQVYAPLDTEETFHRCIFLFVCSKAHCCAERNSNKNWVAFRCQLKRENEFYSSDPPASDIKLADLNPEKFGVHLCRVCGECGPQSCGSCHKVNYCSKEHQTMDWKGGHNTECSDADFKPTDENRRKDLLYEEHEIVTDKEIIPSSKNKEKSEKQRLEDYQKLVEEGKTGTLCNTDASDLQEASSYKSDKAFNKFRKRVKYEPSQILRYDRGGEPLWVSSESTIDLADVPPCPQCKGPRIFEFQIMPQLLNHVGSDSTVGSLDWGTVALYTCQKSCSLGPAYKQEFVWQQDFLEKDVE